MTFFPNSKTFLSIGNLHIQWYAVLIILGALLAFFLSRRNTRRYKYPDDLIEDCKTLHEYIVTFLAILDLAKDQILTFSTDKSDNIWFQRGVK